MNRKKILYLTVLVMLAIIVLTWGSIGSEILAIGLVFLVAGELYRRAEEKRDEIYGDEEPEEE